MNDIDKKLLDACWHGNTNEALDLIKQGADVNAQDKSNNTPLHFACRKGDTKVALALIAEGADVRAQDYKLDIPSNIACSWGHIELCDLVQQHVDKEIADEFEPFENKEEFQEAIIKGGMQLEIKSLKKSIAMMEKCAEVREEFFEKEKELLRLGVQRGTYRSTFDFTIDNDYLEAEHQKVMGIKGKNEIDWERLYFLVADMIVVKIAAKGFKKDPSKCIKINAKNFMLHFYKIVYETVESEIITLKQREAQEHYDAWSREQEVTQ